MTKTSENSDGSHLQNQTTDQRRCAGIILAILSFLFLLGTVSVGRKTIAAGGASSPWRPAVTQAVDAQPGEMSANWSPWVAEKDDPSKLTAFRSACTQQQKGQAEWFVEFRNPGNVRYLLTGKVPHERHLSATTQTPAADALSRQWMRTVLCLPAKSCNHKPQVTAVEEANGCSSTYVYKNDKVKEKFKGCGGGPGFWGWADAIATTGAQIEAARAGTVYTPPATSSPSGQSQPANYPVAQSQTAAADSQVSPRGAHSISQLPPYTAPSETKATPSDLAAFLVADFSGRYQWGNWSQVPSYPGIAIRFTCGQFDPKSRSYVAVIEIENNYEGKVTVSWKLNSSGTEPKTGADTLTFRGLTWDWVGVSACGATIRSEMSVTPGY